MPADDNTFRLALLITIAAYLPYAIYRRIRSFTDEKLDRWQEGPFILFGLRLGGLLMSASIFGWMMSPPRMAWSTIALPGWLRWAGVVIVACGGLLLVWTFHNLGRNLTDTVVTRRNHTLVTTGPYRYVRHPFYLSLALFVLGMSLATTCWLILLTGLIPLTFMVVRTRIEEAKLVERFGVEYQDYMRRVGRFFPRFTRRAT